MADISEKFGLNYLLKEDGKLPDGLTLRDVFAAFALAGLLANQTTTGSNPYEAGLRWCAATAYDLADAMLAQRNTGGK